ncbi:MAG TPA: YraN family protein [Bdellovibrio sp.]|nr:YraN family protein [Bdellovibrio sp.]
MRGLQAESLVLSHYQNKNYRLLHQRVKTPFAEIDLLFRTPSGNLLVVEVKAANLSSFYGTRVSWKQKNRLLRAANFLNAQTQCLVEIHWAFVNDRRQITIFEDICE